MTNGQNNSKKYPYKNLGNELKGLRGLFDKKDFAKQLGVGLRTYYRYESGERKVPDGLLKLAHLLNREYELPARSERIKIAEPRAVLYDIEELLEDARKILSSGNQAAIDALERNIRYFSHAIDLENRLNELENRMTSLESNTALGTAGDVIKQKET